MLEDIVTTIDERHEPLPAREINREIVRGPENIGLHVVDWRDRCRGQEPQESLLSEIGSGFGGRTPPPQEAPQLLTMPPKQI
jgi:hypothetical protein